MKNFYISAKAGLITFALLFALATPAIAIGSPVESTMQQASTIKVTGTVVDEKGEALVGIKVLDLSTRAATMTDVDGHYSIAASVGDRLEFSMIGYKAITAAASTQPLNITLAEDAQSIDQVVVVGYGTQRRSDLTGSVASVKVADVLKSTPTGDMADALQGRLAGVSISSGGAPGSGSTIRIRGVNSVSGDSAPLVVIDGFIGGSLSSINPADIQSIEVLKDASATAIYGSRGANGVILVTTKSVADGRISVTANAFVDIKARMGVPARISAAEYATLANAYGREFNASDGNKPAKIYYTDEQIAAFARGEGTFDYVNEMFRPMGLTQNYELSVAGGTEKLNFLASARYEKEEGLIKGSSAESFNWRLKVDSKIKKWLQIGLNYWGDLSTSSGPRIGPYEALINSAFNYPSVVMPTNDQGNYNNNLPLTASPLYNPMGHINEIDGSNRNLNNRVYGYIQFNIVEGLTFRSQIGVSFGNSLGRSVNNIKSYSAFKNGNNSSASATTNNSIGWLNTNTLNYNKEFNKNHRLNLTAVFEQSQSDAYSMNGSGTKLNFPQLGSDAIGWAESLSTSSVRTINTLMSGLFRVNYVAMNRYAITASIRADGSSRLAQKWDYFPSVAVAWTISEESFLKDVDFLTNLKLRVGYGSVGNQAIDPYRIYSQMSVVNNPTTGTSYTIDRPASPYLRWERNDQINVGLDAAFFNNRLTASVEWYDKQSKDILLEVEAPAYSGWSSLLKNAGGIRNTGFEVTIGGDPVSTPNWNWHADVTLSQNIGTYSMIPTASGMQNQAGTFANMFFKQVQGEKLASFWGYTFDGVWKSDEIGQKVTINKGLSTEKTDTYANIYKVKAGEAKYRDMNMDGAYNADDQGVIGCGQPTFQWGFNNTVRYKSFDLGIFVIGVHGFDIYNVNRYSSLDPVPMKTWGLNRWTKDNENTDIPGFVKAGNTQVGTSNSSRFVEKGDFVKIKSITLGWNLAPQLCRKSNLNALRVYASVQNPFLFTSYSGLDPETSLTAPMTSGVDYEAYPNARSFIVGVTLSF